MCPTFSRKNLTPFSWYVKKTGWDPKMAAKNFTVSHFLKICIEDNLLPYPSDTVSFIHDLNYGYQERNLVLEKL